MFKPTDDPSLSESERIEKDVEKVKRSNDRRDMQRLIQTALMTPINPGEFSEIDGELSLTELASKNTTVRSRIVLNAAFAASNGDDKARTFLFKYGGYEPVKEQNVSVDIPILIDDMDDGSIPDVEELEEPVHDEDPE